MQEIIDRFLQIKNEDDFWFRFFANHILDEFDFDYKQENDELSDQVEELEKQNRQLQDIIDDSIQEVKFYD